MRHAVLLALLGACGDDGASSSRIDADGFVALDASLTFAAGTITGHLYATHCDSLDEMQ